MKQREGGFTLLEICIVLVILAILMGVMSPGIQSALAEQSLRSDARQLSLMVKTAMLRTAEEHHAYTLDLTETDLTLASVPTVAPSAVAAPTGDEAVSQTWKLSSSNKLLLPDPAAAGKWLPLLSAQWTFRPGELCPATQVCFVRGEARLQIGFNALTGNVEEEKSIFP